jgi:hypothetical protein
MPIDFSHSERLIVSTMKAKDLAKEAPASPCIRVGAYAILARLADKGRADIAGTAGDYLEADDKTSFPAP